jgi:O-antigen/teichoic acid export membrane protein
MCIGGAVVVPTLFHVWLDPRWTGAIVPAQCMLLACVPLVTQYISGATLLALNFQRQEALVSIAQTAATVLVVAACAPFGLLAASAGIAARPLLLMPLSVWLLHRYGRVGSRTLFGPQWPALATSLAMGASVWLLQRALGGALKDAILLPVLVATGGVIYAGLVARTMPSVVERFKGRAPRRA